MNILVVDDSPAIQMIVCRALQKEGFADNEFRVSASGDEALDLMESWMPDLIITDWHMPGMSGLELLQVLQQMHGKRLLVGFVTTESGQERLQEAVRNGAAFILSKPFTDQELGAAVRAALAVRAAEDAPLKAAAPTAVASFGLNAVLAIEKYLQKTLGAPVALKEVPAVDCAKLSLPCQLAFYGLAEETAIRGFCVLDRAATAMIRGLMTKISASSIPPQGPLPAALVEATSALLGSIRAQLFTAPPDQPVSLLRAQLLPQFSPKLKEILDKPQGRKCFSISAPGFAAGFLTLIAR